MIGAGKRDEALGMLGAREDREAFSMPTVSSVGEWKISSALRSRATLLGQACAGDVVQEFTADAERPPGESRPRPRLRADGVELSLNRWVTWLGSLARRWSPPPSPRHWRPPPPAPPRRRGCGRSAAPAPAASCAGVGGGNEIATLDENVVLANSPSLEPMPVKSKRSTAMPSA
jgi:hypothetical protein